MVHVNSDLTNEIGRNGPSEKSVFIGFAFITIFKLLFRRSVCILLSTEYLSPHSLPLSWSGADITDYFNYGFTEETWRLYCEKQRRTKTEVAQLNKIAVSQTPPAVDPPSCPLLRRYRSSSSIVDCSLFFGNTNYSSLVSFFDYVMISVSMCVFFVNRFLRKSRFFFETQYILYMTFWGTLAPFKGTQKKFFWLCLLDLLYIEM